MVNNGFEVHFSAGATIFSEGEAGDCAYIVNKGVVELTALINGKDVALASFYKGELFGEMALIDDQVRSGTAIAHSDVSLTIIPKDYIQRNLNSSDDIVHTLLKVMLNRYREMRTRFEYIANNSTINNLNVNSCKSDNYLDIDTEKTSERIQREHKLLNAFEQNHLALYFQPIICLKTKKIAGCESLIRWLDPDVGMIPPIDFIGLAEDSGLINPIGKWIVKEACIARNVFSKFIEDIYVSINLSTKQFDSYSLVDDVRQIFDETSVNPECVYFEITESALMSDPVKVANMINELKELRSKIALDDFGTGYSSFSYLHRFPIDILKIDQSFVFTMMTNEKSKMIVQALCMLAQSLKMKIVAEGIEEKPELDQLRDFDAEYGQGYFIAKPMPQADFIDFIQNFKL